MSMIGLLSEMSSGSELALLVNNELFAYIEFIMKESGTY